MDGYTLSNLGLPSAVGVYGVYAFNSKGGEMSDSEAYYNSDSGFYVGQTPPQKGKKKRTIVKNVDSWGNVLGFSGTNMRYVTITKSRWYNNGAGDRAERARLGEVLAAPGERHRRQRHLLEQLQLLLRRAVQDPGDAAIRRSDVPDRRRRAAARQPGTP